MEWVGTPPMAPVPADGVGAAGAGVPTGTVRDAGPQAAPSTAGRPPARSLPYALMHPSVRVYVR